MNPFLLDKYPRQFRHMEPAGEQITLAEKRKEEKQQQREEKLEELRTAAPNIHLQNNSTSMSDAKNIRKVEVGQMDVEVKSPGNNIARIINIGDNNDED